MVGTLPLGLLQGCSILIPIQREPLLRLPTSKQAAAVTVVQANAKRHLFRIPGFKREMMVIISMVIFIPCFSQHSFKKNPKNL